MTQSSPNMPIPASNDVIDFQFNAEIIPTLTEDTFEQATSHRFQASRALDELSTLTDALSPDMQAVITDFQTHGTFAAAIEDLMIASEGNTDEIEDAVFRFSDNYALMDEAITRAEESRLWTLDLVASVVIFSTYVDGLDEPETKEDSLRSLHDEFEEIRGLVSDRDQELIQNYLATAMWRSTGNTYVLAQHRDAAMAGLHNLELPDIDSTDL